MKKAFCFTMGVVIGAMSAIVTNFIYNKKFKKVSSEKRLVHYYTIMNQWMEKKNAGGSTADYLIENNFHNIIIYGAGSLAERLYEDIKDNPNIHIRYIIDKSQDYFLYDVEVKLLDDITDISETDAIVVTPVHAYKEIEAELSKLTHIPIVSLEELTY